MRHILAVDCIEDIARICDVSKLIDILDDDSALHSNNSSAGFGSGAIDVASPVIPSSWVPFSGLFFVCLFIDF